VCNTTVVEVALEKLIKRQLFDIEDLSPGAHL
jgi:hypothetical protein